MLFRTALKNIRNGLLLNVVAALQMMAAMVITAVLISTILIRFQYYTPMKEYFSANGIYGIFPGMSGKNIQEGMKMDNLLLDDDRLKAELDKPSEVIGSAYTFCFLPNGEGVSSFAYTDNLVQHYTPELSSVVGFLLLMIRNRLKSLFQIINITGKSGTRSHYRSLGLQTINSKSSECCKKTQRYRADIQITLMI